MIAFAAFIVFAVPMLAMFVLGNHYGSTGSTPSLVAGMILTAFYVALAVRWGDAGADNG